MEGATLGTATGDGDAVAFAASGLLGEASPETAEFVAWGGDPAGGAWRVPAPGGEVKDGGVVVSVGATALEGLAVPFGAVGAGGASALTAGSGSKDGTGGWETVSLANSDSAAVEKSADSAGNIRRRQRNPFAFLWNG